jgi:hypothetical protein
MHVIDLVLKQRMLLRGFAILASLTILASCSRQVAYPRGSTVTRLNHLIVLLRPQNDVNLAYGWTASGKLLLLFPNDNILVSKISNIYNSTNSDDICYGKLYYADVLVSTNPIDDGAPSSYASQTHLMFDISVHGLSTDTKQKLRSLLHTAHLGAQVICAGSPKQPTYARALGDTFVTGT